ACCTSCPPSWPGGPGRAEWLRAAELIESAAGEQGTALSSLFTEPPEGESFPLDAGEAAQPAALPCASWASARPMLAMKSSGPLAP
ncbi:MAG: hypothetical protein ACO4CW_10005, partial [Planctomycetota bacterium]